MANIEKLKQIGLSDSEARIYLALLGLGEATIAEISKQSGLHRTNIYDSLERLKEKGLVSYFSKENKQFVRAADPESLLAFLHEQEEFISKLIPELKEVQSKIQEKITIEIFKGKQGMKSALKDVLNKKREVVGYSISGQLRQFLPDFADYYFREQTKHKILHKFIYTAGTIKPPSSYYEIKYLPKEFSSTTLSLCYDDILLNLIWEPEMIAIKIKSKKLSDDFKTHFKLLWKIAKS